MGDSVLLHPKAPAIPVALVDRPRHLCFAAPEDPSAAKPAPARSWSLYLDDAGDRSVRLVLRSCIAPRPSPTPLDAVGTAVEEAVDFVMEQRMLRTIRRLAETAGPS